MKRQFIKTMMINLAMKSLAKLVACWLRAGCIARWLHAGFAHCDFKKVAFQCQAGRQKCTGFRNF